MPRKPQEPRTDSSVEPQPSAESAGGSPRMERESPPLEAKPLPEGLSPERMGLRPAWMRGLVNPQMGVLLKGRWGPRLSLTRTSILSRLTRFLSPAYSRPGNFVEGITKKYRAEEMAPSLDRVEPVYTPPWIAHQPAAQQPELISWPAAPPREERQRPPFEPSRGFVSEEWIESRRQISPEPISLPWPGGKDRTRLPSQPPAPPVRLSSRIGGPSAPRGWEGEPLRKAERFPEPRPDLLGPTPGEAAPWRPQAGPTLLPRVAPPLVLAREVARPPWTSTGSDLGLQLAEQSKRNAQPGIIPPSGPTVDLPGIGAMEGGRRWDEDRVRAAPEREWVRPVKDLESPEAWGQVGAHPARPEQVQILRTGAEVRPVSPPRDQLRREPPLRRERSDRREERRAPTPMRERRAFQPLSQERPLETSAGRDIRSTRRPSKVPAPSQPYPRLEKEREGLRGRADEVRVRPAQERESFHRVSREQPIRPPAEADIRRLPSPTGRPGPGPLERDRALVRPSRTRVEETERPGPSPISRREQKEFPSPTPLSPTAPEVALGRPSSEWLTRMVPTLRRQLAGPQALMGGAATSQLIGDVLSRYQPEGEVLAEPFAQRRAQVLRFGPPARETPESPDSLRPEERPMLSARRRPVGEVREQAKQLLPQLPPRDMAGILQGLPLVRLEGLLREMGPRLEQIYTPRLATLASSPRAALDTSNDYLTNLNSQSYLLGYQRGHTEARQGLKPMVELPSLPTPLPPTIRETPSPGRVGIGEGALPPIPSLAPSRELAPPSLGQAGRAPSDQPPPMTARPSRPWSRFQPLPQSRELGPPRLPEPEGQPIPLKRDRFSPLPAGPSRSIRRQALRISPPGGDRFQPLTLDLPLGGSPPATIPSPGPTARPARDRLPLLPMSLLGPLSRGSMESGPVRVPPGNRFQPLSGGGPEEMPSGGETAGSPPGAPAIGLALDQIAGQTPQPRIIPPARGGWNRFLPLPREGGGLPGGTSPSLPTLAAHFPSPPPGVGFAAPLPSAAPLFPWGRRSRSPRGFTSLRGPGLPLGSGGDRREPSGPLPSLRIFRSGVPLATSLERASPALPGEVGETGTVGGGEARGLGPPPAERGGPQLSVQPRIPLNIAGPSGDGFSGGSAGAVPSRERSLTALPQGPLRLEKAAPSLDLTVVALPRTPAAEPTVEPTARAISVVHPTPPPGPEREYMRPGASSRSMRVRSTVLPGGPLPGEATKTADLPIARAQPGRDRGGLPSEPQPRPGDPGLERSPPREENLESLARRVYHSLRQRLRVERERRGGSVR